MLPTVCNGKSLAVVKCRQNAFLKSGKFIHTHKAWNNPGWGRHNFHTINGLIGIDLNCGARDVR